MGICSLIIGLRSSWLGVVGGRRCAAVNLLQHDLAGVDGLTRM